MRKDTHFSLDGGHAEKEEKSEVNKERRIKKKVGQEVQTFKKMLKMRKVVD